MYWLCTQRHWWSLCRLLNTSFKYLMSCPGGMKNVPVCSGFPYGIYNHNTTFRFQCPKSLCTIQRLWNLSRVLVASGDMLSAKGALERSIHICQTQMTLDPFGNYDKLLDALLLEYGSVLLAVSMSFTYMIWKRSNCHISSCLLSFSVFLFFFCIRYCINCYWK